jgi:hypothetical protein
MQEKEGIPKVSNSNILILLSVLEKRQQQLLYTKKQALHCKTAKLSNLKYQHLSNNNRKRQSD